MGEVAGFGQEQFLKRADSLTLSVSNINRQHLEGSIQHLLMLLQSIFTNAMEKDIIFI